MAQVKIGLTAEQVKERLTEAQACRNQCQKIIEDSKGGGLELLSKEVARLSKVIEDYIPCIGKEPEKGSGVIFNLSEEDAVANAEGMQHAIAVFGAAAKENNELLAGDGFGWLDARMTALLDAIPSKLKPPESTARAGGGQNKP